MSHPSTSRPFPQAPVRADRRAPVSLEVVIPIWNEQDVLPLLFDRLRATFSPSPARRRNADTRRLLPDRGRRQPPTARRRCWPAPYARACRQTLLRLSRNFGHQNAVSAGLAHFPRRRGRHHRRRPPGSAGADPGHGRALAPGQRGGLRPAPPRRAESFVKRAGLLALLSPRRVPGRREDPCSTAATSPCSIGALSAPWWPCRRRCASRAILRAWVGFRQAGLDYDRPDAGGRARRSTPSQKLYRLATDGVVSSSVRPLQLRPVFSVSVSR